MQQCEQLSLISSPTKHAYHGMTWPPHHRKDCMLVSFPLEGLLKAPGFLSSKSGCSPYSTGLDRPDCWPQLVDLKPFMRLSMSRSAL